MGSKPEPSADPALAPAATLRATKSRPSPWFVRAPSLALGLAVAAFVAALAWRLPRAVGYHMIDLHAYWAAVRGMVHGNSLYAHRPGALPFTYPPFAGLALAPLDLVGFGVARLLSALVSLGALTVVAWSSVRLAGDVRPPRLRWAAVVGVCALALVLEPVRATFSYGQVNLVLLALVLADFALPHRYLPRGVLVGLAAAVKLEPAIFIVYLALTRRVKAAVVAAGVFAAALVVSVAVAPADSRLYWGSLLFQPRRIGRPGQVANQSIRGILARATHNSPGSHLLWAVLAVTVLLAGLAVARRLQRNGQELWAICACGLTGLAISPFSWDHHWVWVVPIVAALIATALKRRSIWLWAAAAAWSLLLYLAPIWWVPYKSWRVYHLHGVQLVWGDSFILAGLVVLAVLAAWAFGTSPSTR